MNIIAIDPGNEQSGVVLMSDDYRPVRFGKLDNDSVLGFMHEASDAEAVVIEMVSSYGMPVGRSVFDTCVWIGRFTALAIDKGVPYEYIERPEVKLNICGQRRAKDANIRQALIDRFAEHDYETGKGTKKDPDWFFGFKADVWQAYALGVTWLDRKAEEGRNG